ncbi:MAG: hypothetical protein PUD73_03155 [bacterium]|nr:hypothetical protein [bacterium]
MNRYRRSVLKTIAESLSKISEELRIVLDEETDAYENMPDNLKDGERGSSSFDAIDYLEDASSSIDDIIDTINKAID